MNWEHNKWREKNREKIINIICDMMKKDKEDYEKIR